MIPSSDTALPESQCRFRCEEDELAAKSPRAQFLRYAGTLPSISMIDDATRMGFLTFLPFLLIGKGASLPMVGIALTLVFAGGAVGKLVCAFIGARIGMIGTVFLTEIMTLVLIAS